MIFADYAVLVGYFVILIGIGVWVSRRIKKQDDYFMGGRSFGKLLQTFAAFGAGTGSSDPINTAGTSFRDGMSGMWSVMYWLFVTPFYWITGVWYRRMRHLTLGDWFTERYQSRSLGACYCICGLLFFMVYGAMLFEAIGKFAAPLMDVSHVEMLGMKLKIEQVLVPIIALVVLVYGLLGGLEAAYFTDLIQGMCIIFLSIVLIPFGLNALVQSVDLNPNGPTNLMHGFVILHRELPKEQFSVLGSSTSEFPWYRILAVVVINLVGIVVQPHFIATGGGSAKTEMSARVGLVTGNFLKRFCTVGWVLTALIAAALYSNETTLANDPEKTWGFASKALLGPLGIGLVGLMLACLLAALMSSVDAYMVVGSALVVRNIYAPYINSNATEKQYVKLARITGAFIVIGAVVVSLLVEGVFTLLQLTWRVPLLMAAIFWIGMYWRRASTAAAWLTVTFCAFAFFLIPIFAPRIKPDLRTNPKFLKTNRMFQRVTTRPAARSDVRRVTTQVKEWDKQSALPGILGGYSTAVALLSDRPKPLKLDDPIQEKPKNFGGQSIFWDGGVKPVDENGNVRKDVKPKRVGDPIDVGGNTKEWTLKYDSDVKLAGQGWFQLDFLLFDRMGMDLTGMSSALLKTLELPLRIISPFLVMILFSFITPRCGKEGLDRYYTKMKTPVDPDPEVDQKNLEEAYQNREQLEEKKMFPGSSLEFLKPSMTATLGFIICFLICFAIIGLAIWVASIGA